MFGACFSEDRWPPLAICGSARQPLPELPRMSLARRSIMRRLEASGDGSIDLVVNPSCSPYTGVELETTVSLVKEDRP